jgi:hypothetical protein
MFSNVLGRLSENHQNIGNQQIDEQRMLCPCYSATSLTNSSRCYSISSAVLRRWRWRWWTGKQWRHGIRSGHAGIEDVQRWPEREHPGGQQPERLRRHGYGPSQQALRPAVLVRKRSFWGKQGIRDPASCGDRTQDVNVLNASCLGSRLIIAIGTCNRREAAVVVVEACPVSWDLRQSLCRWHILPKLKLAASLIEAS